ncbi:hypothetical protein WN51_11129 [Melipona quadrifasciata]|uniref:Uncharacterized protein n=1 Tax=Melipona quadrifasciata TaxID=166423 RepID=A0A0N0U623_9HYME|nr:hypothetical protein WN51_11129 [Melipona quadrifasciata]
MRFAYKPEKREEKRKGMDGKVGKACPRGGKEEGRNWEMKKGRRQQPSLPITLKMSKNNSGAECVAIPCLPKMDKPNPATCILSLLPHARTTG